MKKNTDTRLPGNTSGDHDNVSTSQGLLKTIVSRQVTLDFSRGRDVRNICSDSWGVNNIIEAELRVRQCHISRFATKVRTSVTSGLAFRSSAKGWPIPPAHHLNMTSSRQTSNIPAAPRTTALTILTDF
jgi:hypothetical protein